MAVDDDFLSLRAPRREDRDRLAAIFRADSALERARGVRSLLVHLLAVFALPVWLAAVWPGRVSPGLREAALSGWGVGLALVLLAVAHEAWRSRQRALGMAGLPPAVLKTPAGACAGDAEAES
jgi:hypothetical protein